MPADSPDAVADAKRRDTILKTIGWGMAPEDIPGLTQIETDPTYGGIDQYWQPDQPLVLGKALLDGWVYGFWQGELYSIMIWAKGPTGYDSLRQEVFSLYGPGKQSKSRKNCYVWENPDTQRMLEFDPQLKTAIFIMRSSLLDARIKLLYPSQ